MSKWIYHFGAGAAEGNMALKNILGAKGLAWRNVILRASCPCWFYNHNRCLQSLFSPRFNYGRLARGFGTSQSHLKKKWKEFWFHNQSIVGIRSFGCSCFHTDDGHHFEFGLNDGTTSLG